MPHTGFHSRVKGAMGGRNASSLASRLNWLLRDLGNERGFWGRLSAEQLFRMHPVITDELFARTVVETEGMTPEHEKTHLAWAKERFNDRFGQAISAG